MEGLNPTNAFGELLLDLIEAQYEGDYDLGVDALMDSTGLDETEVEGIIDGDIVVDDENLLANIAEAFPDADEEDLKAMVYVADAVESEDREALMLQIDDGEIDAPVDDGEYIEEEEPSEVAASYAQNPYNVANFGYDMDTNRLAHLEQKVANFEQEQAVATFSARLSNLDRFASNAVNGDVLPRSYKTMLIGDFESDSDRLAKFAQVAAENGVDIGTMLFATEFAMGLLVDAADYVEFKDYSISSDELAYANFSANAAQVAAEDYKALKGLL